MAGYFYPPPPAFVGGRQPYSPKLGSAQSGPVPQAPPSRVFATMGIIVAAWTPATFAMPQAKGIAPLISSVVASPPPAPNRAIQEQIRKSWTADPTTVIYLATIAPQLSDPVAPDNPPPSDGVQLNSIVQQWSTPFRLLPQNVDVAPLLPAADVASQPPPTNRALHEQIRKSWTVDSTTVISLASIAPQLTDPVAPDNPPAKSFASHNTILARWTPAYFPLPQGADVAPLLGVVATPDNPPARSYAIQSAIVASWVPPHRPIPKLRISEVVTEVAPDTTPDQFSFTDQSGVALSSTITSAAVPITGIDAAAAITVSGGTYDINGSGTFVGTAGTVNSGDTVRARHTSSASYLTATNTVVTIGGVSDTFTSITLADPSGTGKERNRHFGFGRRHGF